MVKIDFGASKRTHHTRRIHIGKSPKNPKRRSCRLTWLRIQGQAQSLNMRDQGIKVIIGQEKEGVFKKEWDKAVADGWIPGKNLFPMEEAAKWEP